MHVWSLDLHDVRDGECALFWSDWYFDGASLLETTLALHDLILVKPMDNQNIYKPWLIVTRSKKLVMLCHFKDCYNTCRCGRDSNTSNYCDSGLVTEWPSMKNFPLLWHIELEGSRNQISLEDMGTQKKRYLFIWLALLGHLWMSKRHDLWDDNIFTLYICT